MRTPGKMIRGATAIGPAAWKSPIPIDPGPHVVVATAVGHEPWTTNLHIAEGPNKKTVVVPELVRVQPTAALPAPPVARDQPLTLFGAEVTTLRLAGVTVGSAGLACLGLAAYATARAVVQNADCGGTNDCSSEEANDLAAAQEAANLATVGMIAGGAPFSEEAR